MSRMPAGPHGDSAGPEPRWGPSTTHRAKPSMRRAAGASVYRPAAPAAVPPQQRRPADRPPPRRPAAPEQTWFGPPQPRRRGRLRTKVAVVLVLLLAVAVAYPVALGYRAMGALGRVDALSASTAAPTPGRTYLVVGSDSREGTELEAVEGSRTDTMMLLHVPRTGPTVLLSIPRDSYVDIPGYGENKINAAYTFGGPQLLARTVEEATGVQVDDYVETGLAGFGEVVDAVGGITICPATAIQDEMTGLDVQPGCQEVDGDTALDYARTRYQDPRGDLGRVERQREVLAAIAGKGLTPGTMLNPFSAFPLAESGGSALTVDDDTGPVALGRFLLGMRDTAGGDGISLTVPTAEITRRTEHGVVLDWDQDQAQVVFDALRDSETEAIRPIAEAQEAARGG